MDDGMTSDDSLRGILVLSNYYDPSMPSWPEVMGVFGKEMQNRGHQIDWIAPYRNFNGTNKCEVVKYLKTYIYLIPFTNSHNIFLEFLSIPLFQFRLFLKLNDLVRNDRVDIIISRDDAISGLTALTISKLWNIRFAFNYSFPHYLGAKDAYDHTIKNGLKLAYAKALDLLLHFIILPKTDLILPISSRMKDDLIKMGVPSEKMYQLPLGVDTSIFSHSTSETQGEKIKFNAEDFILIYVGSLDKIRGLDVLLRAVEIASFHDNTIRLLFVGGGGYLQDMKRMVEQRGLESIIKFTDRVPFKEVPTYLKRAHVAVSIIKPLECFRVCSPCKLFEYMAMKKPVIANIEIPEHVDVISSAKCGLLTEYSDRSLADAIIKMATLYRRDVDEFNKMGSNGYNWVVSNRTFDILTNDVEQMCKQVVTKK